MGNHHSASHHSLKPRKNVHWKTAGRPAAPSKPEIIPLSTDEEPNAITLRWRAGAHDGGAPLRGYQVECNRLGAPDWIRTSPPVVLRPELVLSGLEPPHRYQFRVSALNAVGASEPGELSDVLTVRPEPAPHRAPAFLRHLHDLTALENDKTEFRVEFTGAPAPAVAWFKDDYEIFSSRRTAICTDETSSVLVFHQTLAGDEGEIRCTATNRSGHAVSRARLAIEAAPKLRYPRQYEDGLLYEVNETVFLKTTIIGRPPPTVEWAHDGRPITQGADERVEITTTAKHSVLKIQAARRGDRGEYQVRARNAIGEDAAAFLVTVTAPPEPPRRVTVARQVDRSVALDWEPPEDDGGCRIGNYVVEYYRAGWNVWLKATTSRRTNVTLFDLIEGSEYRFRVKAESPYGMSAPSEESPPVRIPGRAVDMEFLAVEARIIGEALARDGDGAAPVSPAPRRKRLHAPPARPTDDEIMLVLYPEANKAPTKAEKRDSFQLDAESLCPPPLSLSAPELSPRCSAPFRPLRLAVSSTELLHEHAMARFYKAVAMQEERSRADRAVHAGRTDHASRTDRTNRTDHAGRADSADRADHADRADSADRVDRDPDGYAHNRSRRASDPPDREPAPARRDPAPPEIFLRSDPEEPERDRRETPEPRWQTSFEDDYTASTVSTDSESDGSLDGDPDRSPYLDNEETYNPRDKITCPSPHSEMLEEEEISEREILKPLPLPDPNFVPKPILKKREVPDVQPEMHTLSPKPNGKQSLDQIIKKDVKSTIFKKITKMPKQKNFPFPKILSKKEPKFHENNISKEKDITPKKIELPPDKITDEGRSVIDYYGNIVKEYGTSKKTAAPLYLNTADLKNVAEKQQTEQKQEITHDKKVSKVRKTPAGKKSGTNENATKPNSVRKMQLKNKTANVDKPETPLARAAEKQDSDAKKCTRRIVLRKTERATIVIPIDYQELEKKAKSNVRSAIECAVDVCLLSLAFWVYLFEDERLAVPCLALLAYRRLQRALAGAAPRWLPSRLRALAPLPFNEKAS